MTANYPGTHRQVRWHMSVGFKMHSPVVAELRGVTEIHECSLSVVSVFRQYHGYGKLLTTDDVSIGVKEGQIS